MTEVVTWVATVVVVVLVVAFVWHLISLRHLPTAQRPRTNLYDRQGRVVGQFENPEAPEEAEGEEQE